MPIDKNKSISEIIQEIMDSWEKDKKIGSTYVPTIKEALEMAQAIALNVKRGKND